MEEQRGKRPIFTPIILILLTFSLMGNVFLYTKKIQYDQSDRIERGTAILQSGHAAQAFLDKAVLATGELLASTNTSSRMTAKSKLLVLYRQASALADFIKAAEEQEGKPFIAPKRSEAQFIDGTLTSLEALGNHDGGLTGGEKAYLEQLQQVFTACQQELSSFQHDVINKEQSLVILADDSWPPIAAKLLQQLNEPEDLDFKG